MYNLSSMLQRTCESCGEKHFLTYLEGDTLVHISFAAFLEHVRSWAEFLRERGVAPGDRVGIITQKSPLQMTAFYGCWWVGAIAVPICEALGDLEMGFIIRDSEPKLILVDAGMRAKVLDNAGDVPVVQFSELPPVHATAAAAVAPVPVEADDVAALIYTSGSTGLPKGVMLTFKNFYRNAESALRVVHIRPADSIMSLLPYWHSFALVVEVLIAVMTGARVIVPRDKRDFRKNIGLYRPTILLVVPRIADALKTGIEKNVAAASPHVQTLFGKAMHNASRIFTAGPRLDGGLLRMAMHHVVYDPLVFRKIRQRFGGRIRFLISGGAPLDLEHQIFFKYIGLPVFQGYGLTEATPAISGNCPDVHRLGSSGPVLSWLRPEEGGDYMFKDEGGALGRDLRGELLVKGDCVMKGYWRHTDESAKTLAEGWLHTGDIGYVDKDGFLFLDGRQGNMIVLVGGEKLHPEHVEDAVKNADLVTEAMVIGEKCKNVYACVNVDPDPAAGLSETELQTQLRAQIREKTEHLAPYQRPKDVLVLPEFTAAEGTLTATLKVRRHRVWERYGDRIREFLRRCGEEAATKEELGIASSKVMESLGRNNGDGADG